MEDVKMSNLFDADWVKKDCLENIKLLEEELEFLKAQSIITQYTIDTCGKDYPSYVLEAVQTVHNSIEKRIKKFEQVFRDLIELLKKREAEIKNFNIEIKAKESGIEDLKEHITLLEADLKKRTAEIKEVNNKRWKDLRDINKALGCDGMNGHVDDFAKAVKARAEYAESLSRNTERSDINKLISDYCNKFDSIPPSPDSSDKACVEYLFSVVDLEREHRAAVGKQMVEDYEKDLLKFIYKEYGHRTHLNAETITYNPTNICNTITKIIRDYARSRTRVDILEGRIKCIFDKYKTKFTVDDQVINGDPTISFMLDCIWSWIGSSAELKQKCDFLEDELGKEAVIRECLNRRRMNQTKLDTIEKKLEELLKDVKEELQ